MSGTGRGHTRLVPATLPATLVALLVVAVVALAVVAPAATASSSPRLTHASPADGDRLSAAPASVTLSFSSPLDPARTHVAIVDSAGVGVAIASGRVTGAAVTTPVSIATAGDYRVVYHVGFADAAELTGEIAFAVGLAGERRGPALEPAGASAHGHGPVGPITMVLLAIDVILLVVLAAAIVRRTGRPRRDTGLNRSM